MPGSKGRQLEVEATKDVLMLCGKGNSDAAESAAEDIAIDLDLVKTVKKDFEVVVPPTREAIKDSQDSTEFEVRGGAAKFRGLHAGR